MEALKLFSAQLKTKHDDDYVDRANYFYTPLMFAFFALTIAAKQYVGEPIQCWIPAEFKGAWEQYSENYCFVENTYWVGFNETFPKDVAVHKERELHYYQWVPFMLIGQMLLLLAPKMLWSALSWKTGFNISALTEMATLTSKVKDEREMPKKKLKEKYDPKQVSNALIRTMEYNARKPHIINNGFMTGTIGDAHRQKPKSSSYITNLYLFYKLLNLANTLGQLFLLNKFLGPEYNLWGWGILSDLVRGVQWQHSGHFPRVTFCDVKIREMGARINTNTFQCVLMINMFNEKVYIFIWFWLLGLSIFNAVNLAYWAWISFNKASARSFIRQNLLFCSSSQVSEKRLTEFVDNLLSRDGVTILRLIAANCTDLVASNIIHELWLNAVGKEPVAISTPIVNERMFAGEATHQEENEGGAPNPVGDIVPYKPRHRSSENGDKKKGGE